MKWCLRTVLRPNRAVAVSQTFVLVGLIYLVSICVGWVTTSVSEMCVSVLNSFLPSSIMLTIFHISVSFNYVCAVRSIVFSLSFLAFNFCVLMLHAVLVIGS